MRFSDKPVLDKPGGTIVPYSLATQHNLKLVELRPWMQGMR